MSISDGFMDEYTIGITLTFSKTQTEITGMITLCNRLCRYNERFNYRFYPEFGKKNHRFHIHGVISCTRKNKVFVTSFMSLWRRYIGRADITRNLTNDGYDATLAYVSKDCEEMQVLYPVDFVLPVTNEDRRPYLKLLKHSTLESVTKKHGDYLDADELMEYLDGF